LKNVPQGLKPQVLWARYGTTEVVPFRGRIYAASSRSLLVSLRGFQGGLAGNRGDDFHKTWHHVAIAVKGAQLKVYLDQSRVLVVPDSGTVAMSLLFGGIGNQDTPLIFTNVRLASGGGMNMIGQKFTDAKIVTHGINFDVDKATLRPESMGTLNRSAAAGPWRCGHR